MAIFSCYYTDQNPGQPASNGAVWWMMPVAVFWSIYLCTVYKSQGQHWVVLCPIYVCTYMSLSTHSVWSTTTVMVSWWCCCCAAVAKCMSPIYWLTQSIHIKCNVAILHCFIRGIIIISIVMVPQHVHKSHHLGKCSGRWCLESAGCGKNDLFIA